MRTSRQIIPFILRHYYKSALASWLEEREPGLYQKYASNIQEQRSQSVLEWLYECQSTPQPNLLSGLIMDAFTWCKTPQGASLWHDLHNLWYGNGMSDKVYHDLPDSFLSESERDWRKFTDTLY